MASPPYSLDDNHSPPASAASDATMEVEAALGRRARAGDLAARNELVERNRRLACSLANAYARRCRCSDADLLQAAYLGLVRGADVFDPQTHPDIKYATIARYYIRAELLSYLYNNQLVRVAHSARRTELDSHPLGKPTARKVRNRDWAIQCAARAGSRALQHADEYEIVDRSQPSSDVAGSRSEAVEMVKAAVNRLPALHEDIVRRRFGLGVPRQTAEEIADDYGTNGQAIYNIQRRALAKLRQDIT